MNFCDVSFDDSCPPNLIDREQYHAAPAIYNLVEGYFQTGRRDVAACHYMQLLSPSAQLRVEYFVPV